MDEYINNQLDAPHNLSVEDALYNSGSSSSGLTQKEVNRRLITFGPNQLPEGKPISAIKIFIKQFKSVLVLILVIAAAISFFVKQYIDMWVILSAVLVDVTMGFVQEIRAQKAIRSLKKSITLEAKVIRDSKITVVSASDIVPGDIVILEEGNAVPADGRLILSRNFRTVEAALTGESVPISKSDDVLSKETLIADQRNMAWRGTFAVGGYAQMLVTGTGANTILGDISTSLDKIKEEKSNFSKKTDVLAKQMSLIAVFSSILIFSAAFFIQESPLEHVLLIAIAALVAAIPEGLSVVFSVTLAIGARRMAKRNAIIRDFTATETLGAVSCILTDKTGTLTQNSLVARKVFIPGKEVISVTGEGWFPAGNFLQNEVIMNPEEIGPVFQKLLMVAHYSNNASIEHDPTTDTYTLSGDPTEGALLVLAKKGNIQANVNKIDDLPFDSTLKLRATLVDFGQTDKELFVTGAPEKILELSKYVMLSNGSIEEISIQQRDQYLKIISKWSSQALRVIGLAYQSSQSHKVKKDKVNELVLTGFVGMIDPPRVDVKEAVQKCKDAGIRVIMVTGDHLNTGVAIAKSVGIIDEVNRDELIGLTEHQLAELDDQEFDEAITKVSVFARLTPKMKLRIADRLQNMGHLIAMTGDGINDAPALKQADVGIAMGIMGTDVAREASDVVLADDNFSTIVNAIEEGRIVFNNARQTCFFLVTTNLVESLFLLIAITIGWPLPLTATQILWLNLVTDGVTDVALATEPGHSDVMHTRSTNKDENILNKKILPFLLINIIIMTSLSMIIFHLYREESLEKARTGAFIVLAFSQLFNVYSMRSLRKQISSIGFFSNSWINLAVGFSVIMLLIIVEIPALAEIFHFQSLGILDLLILFAASSIVFWVIEIYKRLNSLG